ncbi:MAG: hypothetical protein ABI317_00840 [Gaiellales bacterium]
MDTHHVEIAVRPLAAWSDEQVSLAYRLISSDVHDLLAAPDAGSSSADQPVTVGLPEDVHAVAVAPGSRP